MARNFVVINAFTDLQDKTKHVYNRGDFYPREGTSLDSERAEELASADNRLKKPLIVEVLTEAGIEHATKVEEPEKEPEKETKEKPAAKKTTKK